jgi:hypothetical protein
MKHFVDKFVRSILSGKMEKKEDVCPPKEEELQPQHVSNIIQELKDLITPIDNSKIVEESTMSKKDEESDSDYCVIKSSDKEGNDRNDNDEEIPAARAIPTMNRNFQVK